MFGSDKCNRLRGASGQSDAATQVPAVRLKRGVATSGCGAAVPDRVRDDNHILVGGDDAPAGGASLPVQSAYVLPPMEQPTDVWYDDDFKLVQDEDDALLVVDNA